MPWYYARNGQRFGPVEETELQRLAGSGQLGPADLTWKPGMPSWTRAGEVPELAPLFRPAAAPAPPPPPVFSPVPPPPSAQPYSSAPSPAPYAPAPPSPQPYSPPPPSSSPGAFSPYAPPAAPLTAPPQAYRNPMFGTTTTPEYASFGSRFAAFLIDQVLLGVGGAAIGLVLGAGIGASGGTVGTGVEMLLNLVGIVIGWVYYAGLESSSQRATLGKRLLGLQVTDLQGQQVDFLHATGRHFGKILSALPLLLGFILMISDEKKQTWHDKMSGCLVLKGR